MLQAAEQKGAKHNRLESFIPEHLDRVVLSTLPSVRSELQQRMEAGKEEFTLAEVGGMLMAIRETAIKDSEKEILPEEEAEKLSLKRLEND